MKRSRTGQILGQKPPDSSILCKRHTILGTLLGSIYWLFHHSDLHPGTCLHRYMPLGERHFDWLVQLSWAETLQLLCWLGILIRAKLFGLRICYSDIEQSLETLNVAVTAQRGVPYRGPLVRPDRPPTPLPPAVYPGASRASGASTAAGSTPGGIRTNLFVRGVARALRSPDNSSRSRSRSRS